MSRHKNGNKIIYQENIITKFLIESPKYGNFEILIDTEDWDKVKQYRWHILVNKNGYKRVGNRAIKSCPYLYLHQLIMNCKFIDHKNLDTLNNRKINLRKCSNSENKRNVSISARNTSGYKGVSLHRVKDKNKIYEYWRASITVNNKSLEIGNFKNKIKAALAYNEAAIKYHGEFARLNEI